MSANLIIDEEGVRRPAADEAVRWEDLMAIAIITTDEGPWLEDFYWVFFGADGTGCAVPAEQAQVEGLLGKLQARFGEAFDNDAVIRASCCTDNATFVCWRRPAAEA